MNKGCYIIYLKPWNIFKCPSNHLIYGTNKTLLLAWDLDLESRVRQGLFWLLLPQQLYCDCLHGVTLQWHSASASGLNTQPWHGRLWPPERAHRRHTLGSFLTRGGRWRPEVRLSEWAGETRGVLLFTGGCQAPQDTGQMTDHTQNKKVLS